MKRKGMTLLVLLWGVMSLAQTSGTDISGKMKEADKIFDFERFDEALEKYLEIEKLAPKNNELLYKLGICYMHSSHHERALPYLVKAYGAGYVPHDQSYIYYDHTRNKYFSLDLDFNLAQGYHLNHQWDSASVHYTKLKNNYKGSYDGISHHKAVEVLDHFLQQVDNGKKLSGNPVKGVVIKNIGAEINTEFEEIAPLITADEKTMFFTSRRPNTTGGKVDQDGKYMEDIYMSKKENGKWTTPTQLNINTSEHDAGIGLSPDGSQLLTYRSNKHLTGDIYLSEFNNNTWSDPKMLEQGINTRNIENSASISEEKNIMVFTSTRPGGFGEEDIYIVRKNAEGKWEEPVNMGNVINTQWDEDAPFISTDGKTLYFSSRGHNSIGGFDIFKSTFDETTKAWSSPKNMGFPINSANDDIFFVFSEDGSRAYYSTHHEDSYGGQDIYIMTIPSEKKTSILSLTVTDSTGNKLKNAKVSILNEQTGEVIIDTILNGSSFAKFKLPVGCPCKLLVKSEGFDSTSTTLGVLKAADFEKKVGLKPKKVVKTEVVAVKPKEEKKVEKVLPAIDPTKFENVYFAYNSAKVEKDEFRVIQRYVDYLKSHPENKVVIVGHTDNVGSDDYNKKLSHNRAENVSKFLVKNGVDSSRIISVEGMSMNSPLEKNDTEEGRKMNRRVELGIK